MNQTNVGTVIIDSVEVTEPYLKMYITKKLLEGGLDASRAGFRYIKEILFMMLKNVDDDRPMCAYFAEFGDGKSSAAKIDKAIGATIDVSLKNGGLKDLDEFMCGAIKRRHTTAGVMCAFKEYLRYCLYNDCYSAKLGEGI